MSQRKLDIMQLQADLWAVELLIKFEENQQGERVNYANSRGSGRRIYTAADGQERVYPDEEAAQEETTLAEAEEA